MVVMVVINFVVDAAPPTLGNLNIKSKVLPPSIAAEVVGMSNETKTLKTKWTFIELCIQQAGNAYSNSHKSQQFEKSVVLSACYLTTT